MHQITVSNESIYRGELEALCQGIKAKSFVDIGSWDGTHTKEIADCLHAKKVMCVDHDKKALAHAKKLGFQILYADLNYKLKLKTSTYDVALINQVIEHIAKTDDLVKEVFRILKPGGTAIWVTPNLASWHNIAATIVGYQPFSTQISDQAFIGNPWHPDNLKPINEEQAHLRVFTIYSLKELLKLHGFTIDVATGVAYYPFSGMLAKILSRIDPTHAAQVLIKARKPQTRIKQS